MILRNTNAVMHPSVIAYFRGGFSRDAAQEFFKVLYCHYIFGQNRPRKQYQSDQTALQEQSDKGLYCLPLFQHFCRVLGSILGLAKHIFVSPSAFSRRAVVSYWRKYVHEVLVNRLGGLSLPRKSAVRLTDRPDMTLDVYRGRKTTMQQQQQQHFFHVAELEHFQGMQLYIFIFSSLLNGDQLLKVRICSFWSKFLPSRIDPMLKPLLCPG